MKNGAGAPAEYRPVSDVGPHEAIGADIADIRTLLEPAGEGKKANFAAARTIWAEGRHSRKDDGSARTLAGFVETAPVGRSVADAFVGIGPAAELDHAERRQWIDKGMTVALKVKILDELDAAAEKAQAGETAPDEGAPHNVDEAWAFFIADGQGFASTAEKRAADYGMGPEALTDPVIVALAAAQQAAQDGDADAIADAREDVRGALNHVLALAVKKYAVEGLDDPIARAEGLAFAWGLEDDLPLNAREAADAAFAADAGPEDVNALDGALDEALEDLGLSGELQDYGA
jgi:hypothetical protein